MVIDTLHYLQHVVAAANADWHLTMMLMNDDDDDNDDDEPWGIHYMLPLTN